MMRIFVSFLIVCGTFAADIYSVDYLKGQYFLRKGQPSRRTLSWGSFSNDVMKDGWGKLYINSNPKMKGHNSSIKTYYAVGYLEGALTNSFISDHYKSWCHATFKKGVKSPKSKASQFLLDQDAFARKLVAENLSDDYYESLERVISQFDGMLRGIQDHAKPNHQLTKLDLLYLQGEGDMHVIFQATKAHRIKWEDLSGKKLLWQWHQSVSCSSIVKATDDWSDVFAAHTTWTQYTNMLRIYKYQTFTGPKPYRVSFSGFPGMIYSKDDFYILPDSEMVVMETTNGIMNSSLYDLVIPQTLLTWQRVPISHQLSVDGDSWTSQFIKHNSGTYNNQYIVVDMKTVKKGKPEAGFIWISETMPGKAKRNDVTQVVINQGNYWPSYNIPFDREINQYAGFQQKVESEGSHYCYNQCPRAQIFRRNHTLIKTAENLKSLIRYNDYQNDPLSQGNPEYAIASRFDLNKDSTIYFGAIDAKVTSKSLVPQNRAWAQSGPSYDQQPIFEWGNFTKIKLGQPDTFDFSWVMMKDKNFQ